MKSVQRFQKYLQNIYIQFRCIFNIKSNVQLIYYILNTLRMSLKKSYFGYLFYVRVNNKLTRLTRRGLRLAGLRQRQPSDTMYIDGGRETSKAGTVYLTNILTTK